MDDLGGKDVNDVMKEMEDAEVWLEDWVLPTLLLTVSPRGEGGGGDPPEILLP